MRAVGGALLLLVACGPRPRPLDDLSDLACPEPPGVPLDADHLEAWVDAARTAQPALDGVELQVHLMASRSTFLRADVRPGSVLRRPARRVHRVHVARALLDDPPPPEATLAILGHELEHLRHYRAMGGLPLLAFTADYVVGGTAAYERGTDARVVALGCGEGLAAYREWLYARLTPRQVRRKQRTYLTPAEARATP